MAHAVVAIIPIFLLILLGWGLRKRGIPGDGFWEPVERLTYFVLFPALLASTLAGADVGQLPVPAMAGALWTTLILVSVVMLALRPLLPVEGPGFSSLYQGAIRFNTYIGLSVAVALRGEAGLAAAAVVAAIMVPVINLLCVAMLAQFGSGARPSPLGLLREVAQNPLILACLVGILLNLSGIGLPPLIGPTLEILGRAALPLGLLAVGAALRIQALRGLGIPTAVDASIKLLLSPAIAWGALTLLGVEGVALFAGVLFTALPTAPSAYILARRLGGAAELMAGLVTAQTLLALVTLPLVLSFML